jgi:hypothetical protein
MSSTTDITPQSDETVVKHPNLTPYAAAIVATRKGQTSGRLGLDSEGKPEEVSTQTMYSKARNHSIKSNYDKWQREGGKKSGYKVEFDGEAFYTWLQMFLRGSVQAGAGRIDYDQLADEYDVMTAVQHDTDEDAEPSELEQQLQDSIDAVNLNDEDPEADESVTDRQMEAEVAETE